MKDDDRWPWPRAGNAILALSLLSWAAILTIAL